MKKKRITEKLEMEHDGKICSGFRVIEGTTRLIQFIVYEGLCLEDRIGYKPNEKDAMMKIAAVQMFSEIVKGNTINASPASKYGIDL